MIDRLDKSQLAVAEKLLQVRHKRVDFAKNHHRNTRNQKMNFDKCDHLLSLYNTLSRKVVIKGSTQSFKTEWAIVDLFSQAACGLSIFYVLPKHDHKTSYVQNRIDKCIQQVPEYKKYLSSGFFDNTTMKNFGKGVIKFVGSNVRSDFREFPADVLTVDEYDECTLSNISYAKDRVGASPYQILRLIANPTAQGVGIEEEYSLSDRREWFVECSCGEWNPLDWFKVIVTPILDNDGVPVDYELMDKDWKLGKKLYPICPHCGNPFERFGKGQWQPQNTDSGFEGYHISRLQSKLSSLSELYLDFRNSVGDTELMKHFWTSVLGHGYSGWGIKVTKELLERCTDDYVMYSRKGGEYYCVEGDFHPGPCSMGIDVGKVFDVRVSQMMPDGGRKMVFVGKIPSKEDLISIGVRYNVKFAVIDSMPEAKIAQEFQSEAPFAVYMNRYGSDGLDRLMKVDKKQHFITCDRTTILDKTFSDLKAGLNILPRNFASLLGGEYLQEMLFSVRESVTDNNGNTKFIWTKGKDHHRHADVYDFLAARLASTSSVPINISIV